jgi:hypothetical protein
MSIANPKWRRQNRHGKRGEITMNTTYTNLDRFESWLKATLKDYNGNLDAYLEDLEEDYATNGTAHYELNGYETKSGNPDTYFYEVEDNFDENGEWISREYIF